MSVWLPELAEFESDHDLLTIDRRQYVRSAPVMDGTQVWLDSNRRAQAELLDESDAGIGVLLPSEVAFTFGPLVTVDHDGKRRTATVAHLTQTADGIRLGLQWKPSAS